MAKFRSGFLISNSYKVSEPYLATFNFTLQVLTKILVKKVNLGTSGCMGLEHLDEG